MDGVLWKDGTQIGNLQSIFRILARKGLAVIAATNNATQTGEEYQRRLRAFGADLEPWQIVTSSDATAQVLADRFSRRGNVFVIGELGIVAALAAAGFEPVTNANDDSQMVAVVVSLDRGLTYQKLQRAAALARSGVPCYATNVDSTFPTPAGLVPGAGAMVAAVASAAGVTPIAIGKPAPFMFELAAARMRLSAREILVVGDRLETDIAGGQALGARTGLVLSGVSTAAEAAAWLPQPDLIAEDLTQLVGF